MREQLAPTERIARIASRQHGFLSRAQLLAAGLTRQGITRQVAAKRLHRLHRGVYAVGHRSLSPKGIGSLRSSPGLPAPFSAT